MRISRESENPDYFMSNENGPRRLENIKRKENKYIGIYITNSMIAGNQCKEAVYKANKSLKYHNLRSFTNYV